MFCSECGTQNPETNQFCKNCGKPLRRAQQAAAPAPAGYSPAPIPSPAPVYHAPPANAAPLQAQENIPPLAKPPLDKKMLLLDMLSILSGAVSWFMYPYICGIIAVCLGAVVLNKSRKKKGALAIFVAILGIIGIIIGLASIVVNVFYFWFFPSVEVPL
jgi:hypothetical protein